MLFWSAGVFFPGFKVSCYWEVWNVYWNLKVFSTVTFNNSNVQWEK